LSDDYSLTTSIHVGVNSNDVGDVVFTGTGNLQTASSRIGNDPDSTGIITVTGAGITWDEALSSSIGYAGRGKLAIENGASVSSLNVRVGELSDAFGDVRVTGSDSIWESLQLSVGVAGGGWVEIGPGGSVTTADCIIGDLADSIGTVIVQEDESTLCSRCSSSGSRRFPNRQAWC
jgi:T5SS/PEP-CTERM-associated repeat protein